MVSLLRRFLVLFGLVAAVGLTGQHDAIAADERRLSFYHTHTHERLDTVFFKDGQYVASALEEVNRFLLAVSVGSSKRDSEDSATPPESRSLDD